MFLVKLFGASGIIVINVFKGKAVEVNSFANHADFLAMKNIGISDASKSRTSFSQQ